MRFFCSPEQEYEQSGLRCSFFRCFFYSSYLTFWLPFWSVPFIQTFRQRDSGGTFKWRQWNALLFRAGSMKLGSRKESIPRYAAWVFLSLQIFNIFSAFRRNRKWSIVLTALKNDCCEPKFYFFSSNSTLTTKHCFKKIQNIQQQSLLLQLDQCPIHQLAWICRPTSIQRFCLFILITLYFDSAFLSRALFTNVFCLKKWERHINKTFRHDWYH